MASRSNTLLTAQLAAALAVLIREGAKSAPGEVAALTKALSGTRVPLADVPAPAPVRQVMAVPKKEAADE